MSERFWTRAQTVLDERRDPLADDELRAWLLEHPEDALELCDLRDALGEIEGASVPLRASRRTRLVPLAFATAALLAGAFWIRTRSSVRGAPARTAFEELALHPISPAPQFGSVQSWVVVSTHETAAGTETVRASAGRIAFETDFPAGSEPLAQANVIVHNEESWSRP
jgi:hypothetical protein